MGNNDTSFFSRCEKEFFMYRSRGEVLESDQDSDGWNFGGSERRRE